MISVRSEWTLKWSPAPHSPSSGHLLRGGSPFSLPTGLPSSRPACGLAPLHPSAAEKRIYLFPGLENGQDWGAGEFQGGFWGSCRLPSRHLQPAGPQDHRSGHLIPLCLCPQPRPPRTHAFGDTKRLSPSPSQLFKALCRFFFLSS
jgi:hypothetical protein